MKRFETGNDLRGVSFSLREKVRMRGQFKLTPSPRFSPVEGEEAERSNFRHDGAR
jgi:hypothetical protein